MNDKFLSMLGMCMRSGNLSPGHDAAKEAVRKKKAKMLIFSSDASERLIKEFESLTSLTDKITIIVTSYTSQDFLAATGKKSAVMSVNDLNFASGLAQHCLPAEKNTVHTNKED